MVQKKSVKKTTKKVVKKTTAGKKTAKKAPAKKKVAAKKTTKVSKKAVPKKKTTGKKTVKKAPVKKKTAPKKSSSKTAKKTVAKKTPAKKAGKKTTTKKKSTPVKKTAKKAPSKKKKSTATKKNTIPTPSEEPLFEEPVQKEDNFDFSNIPSYEDLKKQMETHELDDHKTLPDFDSIFSNTDTNNNTLELNNKKDTLLDIPPAPDVETEASTLALPSLEDLEKNTSSKKEKGLFKGLFKKKKKDSKITLDLPEMPAQKNIDENISESVSLEELEDAPLETKNEDSYKKPESLDLPEDIEAGFKEDIEDAKGADIMDDRKEEVYLENMHRRMDNDIKERHMHLDQKEKHLDSKEEEMAQKEKTLLDKEFEMAQKEKEYIKKIGRAHV